MSYVKKFKAVEDKFAHVIKTMGEVSPSSTEQDINERKIWCLDEFHVLPDTEENIDRNIDIKWDLERIAQTGSCAGLAEYIFELIIYTKEKANSHLNPSA